MTVSTRPAARDPAFDLAYQVQRTNGRSLSVAYVGLATKLRGRIEQHLIQRNSSVTTGVSPVSLNHDLVTEVRWWQHSQFEDQSMLEAAELVAFDVLQPAFRSRGGITDRAKELYQLPEFREEMHSIFTAKPTDWLLIRSLPQAWNQIDELTKRMEQIEARLDIKNPD